MEYHYNITISFLVILYVPANYKIHEIFTSQLASNEERSRFKFFMKYYMLVVMVNFMCQVG